MSPLPITFLSDYGSDDEFAGVCRAVIAAIAPEARVIDLTHGIAARDVRHGALLLANALPYAPPGIHLAVVDPGVGTGRRPVAVRARDDARVLVGPDNGLLWPALESFGGAIAAVDLSKSPHALDSVSATFHGRDLFAPVAARLALGGDLTEAGEAIDPDGLARPTLPEPIVAADHVVAHVLYRDGFGNLALDARPDQLAAAGLARGDALELEVGDRRHGARLGRTFGDVAPGEPLVYEDSSGRLAIAVNRGSAAAALAAGVDDRILIRSR